MAGMAVCQPGGTSVLMEKRKEILSKIAYYCFYAGVIIEVLMVLVDKSVLINPIEGRLFQLTFLLFMIKVCLTGYSRKEYLVIVMFLGLGAVSYFATGRNEIVRVVMFIAACKDIDMKKCLKMVFYLTMSGCLLIMLLSLLGIGGDMMLTQDYGRGSVETRYTLGLGHPNALQCMVWALTALGLYLYVSKMRWYHYLMVLLINVMFFMLSQSKTALMVAFYTIIAFWGAKVIKNKWGKRLFAIGNIGICAGSVILSVFAAKDAMCLWYYFSEGVYSEKAIFYSKINKILTGRIQALFGTTNKEGTIQTWSLFSRPENNYYFDMGWVRLFYWYGIIPACIGLVVLFCFLIYFYRKDKLAEIVLITVFSLYTIVEAHAISVYLARNYVLFILGMYWYRLKRK